MGESATNTIFSLVSAQPGITLNQLLYHAQGVSADDINFLIASEKIYVDLTAAPLAQPENCFIFRDQQTGLAYRSVALSQASTNVIASPVIEYQIGTSVCYDGKDLSVCLVGNTQILLQTENFESVELKRSDFDNYLRVFDFVQASTQSPLPLSRNYLYIELRRSAYLFSCTISSIKGIRIRGIHQIKQ